MTIRSSRWSMRGSCTRLIPDSTLHVYSGGHLELAVDTERIVRVVEAFLSPEEPRMAQVASEHSGNRSGRTSSEVTGLPGEIIEGKVPLRSISQADIMPERRASAAAASLARP